MSDPYTVFPSEHPDCVSWVEHVRRKTENRARPTVDAALDRVVNEGRGRLWADDDEFGLNDYDRDPRPDRRPLDYIVDIVTQMRRVRDLERRVMERPTLYEVWEIDETYTEVYANFVHWIHFCIENLAIADHYPLLTGSAFSQMLRDETLSGDLSLEPRRIRTVVAPLEEIRSTRFGPRAAGELRDERVAAPNRDREEDGVKGAVVVLSSLERVWA